MKILLQLFWNFLLVGLFAISGGFVALPLLQDRLVTANHWLNQGQFADLLAFSRMMPGAPEISMASYTGYSQAGSGIMGLAGALVAVAAILCASFLTMSLSLKLFARKESFPQYSYVLKALRPVTAGLALAFLILLLSPECIGTPMSTPWQFWINIFLFAFTLMACLYYRFSPVFILLLCGMAGCVLM